MTNPPASFTRRHIQDAMDLAGSLAGVDGDRLARTEALARGLCRMVGGVVGIAAIVDNFRPEVPWPTQVWGMDFGFPRESQRRRFFESLRDPGAMHPLLEAFRQRERRPIAARREDLVSDAEWFGSTFWQRYGRHAGIGPMLYTVYPLEVERQKRRRGARGGDEPESFRVLGIGIHRLAGEPAFTPQDRDLVDIANTSLAWFYGSLGGRDLESAAELSPRLRRVLEHLLAGQSEKQVARTIGLTRNTVHEYVKAIYRHFGVGSRAELFARFSGSGPAQGSGDRPLAPKAATDQERTEPRRRRGTTTVGRGRGRPSRRAEH